jgi:hypothetical protein
MFFYNEENIEASQITPPSEDPYFNNVSLLLKMDTDFSDSSQNQTPVTVYGNTSIDTTNKKYGTGSGYFDGSGDVLRLSGASWGFGTGDFTIEMWANFPVLGNYGPLIETNHYTNGILWRVMSDGRLSMWFSGVGGPQAPAGSVTANTWHHIALTRTSGIARVFIDGVVVATNTNTQNVNTNAVRIGQSAHSTSEYLRAYLDDFRITAGVSRYTDNFTPPDSLPTS